jgi:hypothetical protein
METVKMSVAVKHESRRLIRGVIAKCNDGRWADKDGLPMPERLLVVGTTRALQCWREQMPIDTIVEVPEEPLPDVAGLNEQIPQNEWEAGLDGKPRPPWQLNYVVYLVNAETGDFYTYLNSTVGARIAFDRLNDRLEVMRRLRGINAMPVVALDSRPMKTNFGTKLRPEFWILEWLEMAAATPAITHQTAAPQIEHTVTPAEQPKPAAEPSKEAEKTGRFKATKVGKPVEPVSLAEEMNDEIPF